MVVVDEAAVDDAGGVVVVEASAPLVDGTVSEDGTESAPQAFTSKPDIRPTTTIRTRRFMTV